MNPWVLSFNEFKKDGNIAHEESLCTCANGYFSLRGALSWKQADGEHYPALYMAGGYNRVESFIKNRTVINEDFVNWPNPLFTDFFVEGRQLLGSSDSQIIQWKRELDLRAGILSVDFVICDVLGRKTKVQELRLVSMDQKHSAVVSFSFTALNWQGEVEATCAIDARVTNSGVQRYGGLNNAHVRFLEAAVASEDCLLLEAQTTQSELKICLGVKTRIVDDQQNCCVLERKTSQAFGRIEQKIKFFARRHHPHYITKFISLHSSKDQAMSHPKIACLKNLRRMSDLDELRARHAQKWRQLWENFDIKLEGMPEHNRVLRLHIFHLLQSASHHSIDLDVSVGARGLHGEAYRGHIFWDELFIMPFYSFRMPELARSLLKYRYRRLDAARELARQEGFAGALYPWQSGSDGQEESQVVHLNPNSGRWVDDHTRLQRHINGAIVYNIVKYYEVTDDHEFLRYYGAEIIFEIAKFWVSASHLCSQSKRYEICHVVGPDEFHTAYPSSSVAGINNNSYTNFMASWCIRKALSIFELLNKTKQTELLEEVGVKLDDLYTWERVGAKMLIPMQDGLIWQFSGYEELGDYVIAENEGMDSEAQRLDRILEAQGKNVNEYKVNKQADVLMLFYLFSTEELIDHFKWMGIDFSAQWIPKNIEYYVEKSSHGSSLSRVVHAWVMSRMDRARSWKFFEQALYNDINDTQKGTTGEGIHLGAMAGTVDMVARCYSGIEIRRDALWFNPGLPNELKSMNFRVKYKVHLLEISIDHKELRIKVERSWMGQGRIGFRGKVYEFGMGDEFCFSLCEDEIRHSFA